MIYAMTLLISVAVTGAGITLVTVQRADRNMQHNLADVEQARYLGQSALEWTYVYVEGEPNWRTLMEAAGSASLTIPALGTTSVAFNDGDGVLDDNDTDTVTLSVVSTVNGLTNKLETSAQSDPHPLLGYALFVANVITLEDCSVRGPIYAGQSIVNAGGVVSTTGNGSYSVPAGGTISPGLAPRNTNAELLTPPRVNVAYYVNRATAIGPTSTGAKHNLDDQRFTPTANSQGAANADGVYVLDIGKKGLDIRRVRLKGTLIIRGNGGNNIHVTDPVWFDSGRSDFPTLIVDVDNASVDFDIPNSQLVESNSNVDFNEDGDKVDVFDPSVGGLVWVRSGSAELRRSAWTFKGSLVAPSVRVRDGVVVNDQATLAAKRIPGFTDNILHLMAGSTREMGP